MSLDISYGDKHTEAIKKNFVLTLGWKDKRVWRTYHVTLLLLVDTGKLFNIG